MRRDRAWERWFLAQDLVVVLAAVVLAKVLREALVPHLTLLQASVPLGTYVHLLLVFIPTWGWGADRYGLQRLRIVVGAHIPLMRALLLTQGFGLLALMAILVLAQAPLNRSLIALFVALSTLLLAALKYAQRAWVRRTRGRIVTLALGTAPSERLEEFIRLGNRSLERIESLAAERLRTRLRQGGVDEIVVLEAVDRERFRPLVTIGHEAGLPVLVATETFDLDLPLPHTEAIGRTLWLAFERGFPDRPSLLFKNLLDRVASALALLLLWPLLLLIAVLVKLTSPGPALFVQPRGGLNGRPFRMLKFRTMRVGAEAEREGLLGRNEMDGPVFKLAEDPRVTQIGGFLRRWSLDEWPQLVNVLLGQMSLVGPRPLPIVETTELSGAHRRRLSMKPGLTCLWQVSGRNEVRFEDWMTLDLRYVDGWSLGLDFVILLRTLPALLSRRGAR
jgi:exopolysaccharide biosynthesis polyprenyl glycosylphosphotransferase